MKITPEYFKVGTTRGQPVVIGGQTLAPEAQVVALTTPFGGFVWNRPTAVWRQKEGVAERVPIVDVTRYTLAALWGLGLMITALAWIYGRRQFR